MKVVGIIAEYNPFHTGHAYQIAQARKLTQADAILILMSGNVVQRGEFALLDKWHRAELAVNYGADLVLEMPVVASLQSADYFADWSINLMAKLNVDTVVFGTESASVEDLLAYQDWYINNEADIDKRIQGYLKEGLSYPLANQMAIESLIDPMEVFAFDTTSANHLLAIQYVKANLKLDSVLKMVSIPRISRNPQTGQTVLSGSAIRKAYWAKQDLVDRLPDLTYQKIMEGSTVRWSDYYRLLRYQVLSQSSNDLKQYHDIGNGLESFIYQAVKETEDYNSLLNHLTTKRWPSSSIQRKLMTLLLNIREEEWKESEALNKTQAALRVLAFSPTGQTLLKTYRGSSTVSLFSNLTQSVSQTYALNLKADLVLQENLSKKLEEQNSARYPIKVKR